MATVLERLDEHLAVANEHMARGNELMAENRQAFQDLRVELRQMSLRGERVARECIAELRDQRGVLQRQADEFREESRAQHRALFAIPDRLQGSGPSPAGA